MGCVDVMRQSVVSKIEKFKMLTKTHMGRRVMCQPSAHERYMYECHVAHYYLGEIIPSFSAYRRYVSLWLYPYVRILVTVSICMYPGDCIFMCMYSCQCILMYISLWLYPASTYFCLYLCDRIFMYISLWLYHYVCFLKTVSLYTYPCGCILHLYTCACIFHLYLWMYPCLHLFLHLCVYILAPVSLYPYRCVCALAIASSHLYPPQYASLCILAL